VPNVNELGGVDDCANPKGSAKAINRKGGATNLMNEGVNNKGRQEPEGGGPKGPEDRGQEVVSLP